MQKNIFTFTFFFSIILVLSFLFVGGSIFAEEAASDENSAAQTEQTDIAVPEEIQDAIETAADESLKEEQKPEEVKIDTTIKAEDLGVKEARVLPDNPLYGFKNMFRGIRSVLTFDPVKKAEYQLKVSNEKMVEAKQLIENKKTDKAKEMAQKTIESANKDFNKIVLQADKLKRIKTQKAPQVNKFLDKVADHSLKQQVLLQRLEEQVPEKNFVKIEEMRQRHLERFGEVMNKVAENKEEIRDRFAKVVEERDGSDFKEMKAIEILRDLEDKATPEQKEALRMAQKAVSQRFEERMVQVPPEIRKEKLQKYVEFLPGNAVRQFEAFDAMKQNFESPGMAEEMELAKDRAIGKFENQFANFQGEEGRRQFMAPWQNGDPEDLRTMTEIRMRLEPPELAQDPTKGIFQQFEPFKQEAEQRFRQRFEKNPDAFKNNPALQRMRENPDIVDLKFSQDLSQIMKKPDGQSNQNAENFVREFQEQTAERFVENIMVPPPPPGERPEGFQVPPGWRDDVGFGPPVPGGLEVLQEIKDRLPQSAQQGINKAINAQTEMIERHMENTDDPTMFQRFERQIENNSEIKKEMRARRGAEFFNQMDERGREMEKVKQEREDQRWQKMQEINQQMFGPDSENRKRKPEDVPEAVRNIKPETKSKIEQFRRERPQQQQPPQIMRPEERRERQEGRVLPGRQDGGINRFPDRNPAGPPERPIIPLPGSKGFNGPPEAAPKPEEINPSTGSGQVPPPQGQQQSGQEQPLPAGQPQQPMEPASQQPAPAPPAPSPAPTEPTSQNLIRNFLGAVSKVFMLR